MKIGFTGTRRGMTRPQELAFMGILEALGPFEFHHGDCVGADAEAHHIARLMKARVVIHPPVDAKHRALCKGDEELPPLTHFARNRAIVDGTDLLIAASVSMVRLQHGGTWYTVDYAARRGKPVKVMWPDGRVADWRT